MHYSLTFPICWLGTNLSKCTINRKINLVWPNWRRHIICLQRILLSPPPQYNAEVPQGIFLTQTQHCMEVGVSDWKFFVLAKIVFLSWTYKDVVNSSLSQLFVLDCSSPLKSLCSSVVTCSNLCGTDHGFNFFLGVQPSQRRHQLVNLPPSHVQCTVNSLPLTSLWPSSGSS